VNPDLTYWGGQSEDNQLPKQAMIIWTTDGVQALIDLAPRPLATRQRKYNTNFLAAQTSSAKSARMHRSARQTASFQQGKQPTRQSPISRVEMRLFFFAS
jgi:hypothetical protein